MPKNNIDKKVDFELCRLEELIDIKRGNIASLNTYHTIFLTLTVTVSISLFASLFGNLLIGNNLNLNDLGLVYLEFFAIMVFILFFATTIMHSKRQYQVDKRNFYTPILYKLSKHKFGIKKLSNDELTQIAITLDNETNIGKTPEETQGVSLNGLIWKGLGVILIIPLITYFLLFIAIVFAQHQLINLGLTGDFPIQLLFLYWGLILATMVNVEIKLIENIYHELKEKQIIP